MPNLILIRQDGTIQWRHQGYMPGEEKEIKGYFILANSDIFFNDVIFIMKGRI